MYAAPVLCILLVIPALCKGHNESCTVIPKGKYLEMGSDLKVECWSACVEDGIWATRDIYWKLNSSRIDDKFSETINSTYTALTLRNFSYYSATVECYISPPERIVGGTIITTYPKPRNISCVLKYIDKVDGIPNQISCVWELAPSSLEVEYTTVIKKSGSSSESPSCISKTTVCTKVYNLSFWRNISVTVRAKTSSWESEASADFNPLDILQLTPPKIAVTPYPNHLLVALERPSGQQYYSTRCQVRYRSVYGSISERVLDTTVTPKVERGHVKIEDVESCTRYLISGRCALGDAPWSEWSNEVPALSQLNNDTLKFNLWRKIAKPNINGIRKVVLMWEGVPPTCKGNFTYLIDWLPNMSINQSVMFTPSMGVDHTANSCSPTACEVDVNEDAKTVHLTVYLNNKHLREESIYVPATGERVPQVSYIQTSAQEGDIVVSWAAPNQTVSSYMVDWTSDGVRYFWREVRDTSTTLTGLQNFTQYNISVTPLFDDKTGLEKQATPICSTERVPDAFSIGEVQHKDRSAFVTWSTAPQKQCSSAITSYIIFYFDPDNQFNVTVQDVKNEEVLLKNLKPATRYGVKVVAVTLAGSTSSDVRHFETKLFDTSLILILGGCASVVIVIVLLLVLCCALQYKKMVPNPGLSSLAEWSCPNYKKFIANPSESLTTSEKVYKCELFPSRVCRPLLATSNTDAVGGEPSRDQTQEPSPSFSETTFSDGAESDPDEDAGDRSSLHLDSHPQGSQDERPADSIDLPPPTEPVEHGAEESSPANAYRSQEGGTSPGILEDFPRTPAQSQIIKTLPLTAYVTVNMLEPAAGS